MTCTRSCPAAWLLLAMLLSALPLSAQYTTASLGGSVLDPSGSAVPEASISLTSKETGLSRTGASDGDGAFLFSALPVGVYELTAARAGFQTYRQVGITLTVGQAASLTVRLAVGETSQSVTVSADASALETREATVSQLVGARQVLDLPLNGRQAQSHST